MPFQAESPTNYQQKCLCVLVLDVSGSMRKPIEPNSSIKRIDKLNEGIRIFFDDIINNHGGVTNSNIRGQLEVAIIKFDQEPTLVRKPHLLELSEVAPVLTERGSTTETVKAIELALEEVNKRKRFYDQTGQTYYRPWIVLISDGNPTSSQESIEMMSAKIQKQIKNKQISIIGVSVTDYMNQDIMCKLSGGHNVSIRDFRFAQFFKWLSNSFSTITKSNDDDGYDISEGSAEWMKNIPE